MTIVIDTEAGIQRYGHIVLRQAIKAYGKCGLKVNRAYTPTRMLKRVEEITGRKFYRDQWKQAFEAMTEVIGDLKKY